MEQRYQFIHRDQNYEWQVEGGPVGSLQAEFAGVVDTYLLTPMATGKAVLKTPTGSHTVFYHKVGKILHVQIDGEAFVLEATKFLPGHLASQSLASAHDAAHHPHDSSPEIKAPMPGTIVRVNTEAGSSVKKGHELVVLEAMKMEHSLVAPFDAKVAKLHAQVGGKVESGQVLVVLVSVTPEAES